MDIIVTMYKSKVGNGDGYKLDILKIAIVVTAMDIIVTMYKSKVGNGNGYNCDNVQKQGW